MAIAVDESEATRERRSAVRALAEVTSDHADPQGVRRSRPRSGRIKRAAPRPTSRIKGAGGAVRLRCEEAILSKDQLAALPASRIVPDHVTGEGFGEGD